MLPWSWISNPYEEIVVFWDLNKDFVSLWAVWLFLLNITFSVSILKSFDLNLTLFFNKTSSLFKKLPCLAVIYIFSDLLLIANLGSVISILGKLLSKTLNSELLKLIFLEKMIIKNNINIDAPKKNIIFLFIYKKNSN